MIHDPPVQKRWETPVPAITVPASELSLALDRAASFFAACETRPGVLARRLSGQARPQDDQLTDHLVRERRRRTRIDGSMDGSLLRTAWTAWELMDLGCPKDHAAVVRTVGYVLAQQERGGHFAEGCTPERHARRVCYHHQRGFFSPGTRDREIAPVGFPSGVVVATEEEARFAVSCFALRAALRAGEDRRGAVRLHVESLLAMDDLWAGRDWAPDLAFFALGALGLAPLQYRDQVEQRTAQMLSRQEAEGGWPDADLFHALDMLMSIPTAETRRALQRAAPHLCSLQQESGAFDTAASQEHALIALRVLAMALE